MKRRRPSSPARAAPLERFRAGCGREVEGPGEFEDLAYRDLAFAECPACVHRLTPEDGPAFCRWLRVDAPHPFATLAGWTLE